MTTSEDLFPDSIKVCNLQHAHRLLVYFLRRSDTTVSAPRLEYVMRNVRNVGTQHLPQFYQILSSLVHALIAYAKWEESCTLSGAYRKDLELARQKLTRIVDKLEYGDSGQAIRILQALSGCRG